VTEGKNSSKHSFKAPSQRQKKTCLVGLWVSWQIRKWRCL